MATSFKLLRTDTADKRPTAAQLSIGELGLNYDATTPGLFFEDDAGAVRKLGPMQVSSSAPNASPAGSAGNSAGELWLDNSTGHVLKYYTGSGWQSITNSSTGIAADTQVVFNDSGSLSGDSNFTFDADNDVLSVTEIESRLDGPVVFEAKSAGALSKGDVVYVSSVSGNFPVVDKAQANSASTMPAFGIANNAASGADETVIVVTLGTIKNIDTDTPGYTLGQTLYVSATTAGGIVTTAPAGESNLIQNIGRVQRVHASTGEIKVGGAGRTNATPNLNDGNIFIGDSNNRVTTQSFTTFFSNTYGVTRSGSGNTFAISDTDITLYRSLNFNQASDISVPDAQAAALEVKQGSTAFLTLNTTDYASSMDYSTMHVDLPNATFDGTYVRQSTGFVLDTGTVLSGNAQFHADSSYYYFVEDGNNSKMIIWSTLEAGAAKWVAVEKSGADFRDLAVANNDALGTVTTSTLDGTDTTQYENSRNQPTADSDFSYTNLGNDGDTVKANRPFVQTLSTSILPSSTNDLVVEATSNTTLTFKLKGSDGVVRTGTLTLS